MARAATAQPESSWGDGPAQVRVDILLSENVLGSDEAGPEGY